jgi:uncharacterized protein
MPSWRARRRFIRADTLNGAPINVEIAYAEPRRAIVKTLLLPAGSCVEDAVRSAALDPAFAAVDLANSALGIFGRVIGPDHRLKDGDRIEIYRPLAVDPKAARRARARGGR